MHHKTWKRAELEDLKWFKASRVADSGGSPLARDRLGFHTSSDSDHPNLYIEHKMHARMAVVSLYLETVERMRENEEHGKTPVLLLRATGRRGNKGKPGTQKNPTLVVCDIADLERVYEEWVEPDEEIERKLQQGHDESWHAPQGGLARRRPELEDD
jgi:hypothetical protein